MQSPNLLASPPSPTHCTAPRVVAWGGALRPPPSRQSQSTNHDHPHDHRHDHGSTLTSIPSSSSSAAGSATVPSPPSSSRVSSCAGSRASTAELPCEGWRREGWQRWRRWMAAVAAAAASAAKGLLICTLRRPSVAIHEAHGTSESWAYPQLELRQTRHRPRPCMERHALGVVKRSVRHRCRRGRCHRRHEWAD